MLARSVPNPHFSTLTARDGLSLRTAVWPARPGGTRGTVVLLQGRAECIEKYKETAGDLLDRGFAVYAFDWRGQGGSGRVLGDSRKGHVADYDDYLSDFELFLERRVLPDAPRPILVLAHSMGGHIVLRHRAEYRTGDAPYFCRRDRLSAPMVDLMLSPFLRLFAGGPDQQCHKPETRQPLCAGPRPVPASLRRQPADPRPRACERTAALFRDNPALAVGWPTMGWLAATRRSVAILRGRGYPERIATPVLMIRAEADKVVSNAAQTRLAARLPDCRFETIPASRHEPLMETDEVRAQVFALFDAFVERVLGSGAQSPSR